VGQVLLRDHPGGQPGDLPNLRALCFPLCAEAIKAMARRCGQVLLALVRKKSYGQEQRRFLASLVAGTTRGQEMPEATSTSGEIEVLVVTCNRLCPALGSFIGRTFHKLQLYQHLVRARQCSPVCTPDEVFYQGPGRSQTLPAYMAPS